MKLLPLSLAALTLSAGLAHAEMTLSFAWGATPACNTGRAKTVGNPEFVLKGVPAGTTSVDFRMKDLDAPQYNHGGGRLKITKSGRVPAGTFTYKGPCPPRGAHRYVWTATARNGNKVLARATARRKFPE
ncbi:hypothetical protein RGUI_3726 [Rhodovulum sp. P5]|uniref:YbhB/YbcL family Raf kinase inhibitor-like protein n=1 Tax=Rhodovulum sp. P5 TaxID=1564506 RepID=UPI0009C267F9|nr:YbhB/YbcL family Raf kinase inhibitor-like protein [Rhodovulum sp. P5]ARE41867.1 hypothetical protein RGUI_3726 [Rhodovulum sp. P5]